MRLSDLDAQIAATETEILSLQYKLIRLRRQRNALVPLYRLPQELVISILKILANDADALVDWSLDIYSWTQATQFCSYWRDLALDCPSLWTTIVAARPEWFSLFLDRSKNLLLRIDAWREDISSTESSQIFERIAANMRRIRSLCIRPTVNRQALSRLRNVAAPELTTLTFATSENFRPSISSPAVANVMPKLKQLEVTTCAGFDWNLLLPSHLPTVTDVLLRATDVRDQLDILRRCTSVQNLTIFGSYSPFGFEFSQNATVHLPNLEYISLSLRPSMPLVQLSFPSVKSIAIEWGIAPYVSLDMDRALEMMPRFFAPFTNSNDPDMSIHSLWLSCHSDKISLVSENRNNEILVQVHVQDFGDRDSVDPLGYMNLFDGFAQFSQTLSSGIHSFFEIRGRPELGLRALFAPFEHQPNVTTIALWNEFALIDFLSHSRTICKPDQGSSPEPCGCTQCHEVRLTSFPRLTTICLLEVDEGVVVEYNGINWLELLSQWVKDRKERDLGLDSVTIYMQRISGKHGQAAINGLMQMVPEVALFDV